jgi:hypothetical protein
MILGGWSGAMSRILAERRFRLIFAKEPQALTARRWTARGNRLSLRSFRRIHDAQPSSISIRATFSFRCPVTGHSCRILAASHVINIEDLGRLARRRLPRPRTFFPPFPDIFSKV